MPDVHVFFFIATHSLLPNGIGPQHRANHTEGGDILKNRDAQGTFDSAVFLANAGLGRKIVQLEPGDLFFSQGDSTNAVFYLQTGKAKLTSSRRTTSRPPSRFSPPVTLSEKSRGIHSWTASGDGLCRQLMRCAQITRKEMVRVMHDETAFADLFSNFCWPAVCGPRPISSISSSIPAKSVWRGFSF